MNRISYLKRIIKFFLKKKKTIFKQNNRDLDFLFKLYGTDKSSDFHGFSEFYEKHFSKIKDEKITIVELGSARGASASALYSYFKNSNIYCLDNHIENFEVESENIYPILIDCSNEKNIKKFYKKKNLQNLKIDILIDDGSHRLDDIINSIKFHFKEVKSNGYYIIEDYMHPNYYEKCNNNSKEIKVDKILENIKQKKCFNSKILSKEFQQFLFDNIKEIKTYKGKRFDSDICFIKKK